MRRDVGPAAAPNAPTFAFFDTPVGRCALVWTVAGVTGLLLPSRSVSATRAQLVSRHPDAIEAGPPPAIAAVMALVVALLRGEPVDLSAVLLDLQSVPPFHRRVYEVARTIPRGATLTYGEVAARVGVPGSARAVGQALGRNPVPVIVPCHRVLAAGGRIGGFSAPGGAATKQRLLAIEGHAGPGGLFAGDSPLPFEATVAVDHLREVDARMRRLVDRVGPLGLQVEPAQSLFAALAESIVYQQLNGRAAATIFGRLRALFPRGRHGFRPELVLRVPEDALRAAGLSQAKRLALQDLARRCAGGELPTIAEAALLDDETLVERLTLVRGIGRWTVEMLLIFRLGRPDVLPVDDYGVRKGFAAAYGRPDLPSRDELRARGARWAPFRTAASWYLWRAADAPPS